MDPYIHIARHIHPSPKAIIWPKWCQGISNNININIYLNTFNSQTEILRKYSFIATWQSPKRMISQNDPSSNTRLLSINTIGTQLHKKYQQISFMGCKAKGHLLHHPANQPSSILIVLLFISGPQYLSRIDVRRPVVDTESIARNP